MYKTFWLEFLSVFSPLCADTPLILIDPISICVLFAAHSKCLCMFLLQFTYGVWACVGCCAIGDAIFVSRVCACAAARVRTRVPYTCARHVSAYCYHVSLVANYVVSARGSILNAINIYCPIFISFVFYL